MASWIEEKDTSSVRQNFSYSKVSVGWRGRPSRVAALFLQAPAASTRQNGTCMPGRCLLPSSKIAACNAHVIFQPDGSGAGIGRQTFFMVPRIFFFSPRCSPNHVKVPQALPRFPSTSGLTSITVQYDVSGHVTRCTLLPIPCSGSSRTTS